jgi:hypothetical protein
MGKRVGGHALKWTPPLPEFERTLNFYQDNGLVPVGGRKMRQNLAINS